MSEQENVIETYGLTVFYGKQRGILNVNLEVKKGEIFGFLGPNGAGKTTTLRVLLDVIRPNRGAARIFGLDCQEKGVTIRQQIGYIPGELNLSSHTMRGRQYLNMIDAIRTQKANMDYRRTLYSRFDLDVSRRIRNYSRGNKQKLALVAAFMHKPELLILDEPTGGLDPLIQQAVLDTVQEAKNEGRTVFFSSHILPEVQAVCDRVGVIRNGELVAVERVEDLLKRRSVRIRLSFSDPVHDGIFLAMENVNLIHNTPDSTLIEIQSGLSEFMQTVAPYGITDIETENLSLEDAFMAYYGRSKA